jgi:DNA-binding GntR family transcriptional regulator
VNLAEQAYQRIRDRILRGELPMGAVLSRRNLAEEFGMSFLPVSEALQRLEADELVESRARVGTRVRIPSPGEVRDRYVLREALETQSARLCAQRASFPEGLELRRLADQMDSLFERAAAEVAGRDFLYAVHIHHFNLHMKIAEFARCEGLRHAIERNHVLVFNWHYDNAMDRRALPRRFHSSLVEEIVSGDVQRADAAMRAHIQYGIEEVVHAIENLVDRDSQWRTRREHGRPSPAAPARKATSGRKTKFAPAPHR